MKEQLQQEFNNIYGAAATNIYFSPGRVNLIGEHIDYNGGLVMPCAISFGTYLLVKPNHDHRFRFKSLNFNDYADIATNTIYHKQQDVWYNYPAGIIEHFKNNGKNLDGLDMLFYGDIPISSGLSSSASIEVVTAFALNDLFDADYSKLDMVKLSQSVENNFIGVSCGIMDQFAVAFGEKDKALKLNCDTLDYEAVDSNLKDHVLAIINTNKPRKLSGSKYNERVLECKTALTALQQQLNIHHLCDIDRETFYAYQYLITDSVVKKRARHVIEENDRVKLAARALNENDLNEFGRLMYASHNSLRDLYEVTGMELDTIVDYCKNDKSVTGARMTGAGFGGCAIALVKATEYNNFSEAVITFYTDKIGYAPSVYSSLIGDGVRELLW